MNAGVINNRKENLIYLIRCIYGTQKKMAVRLKGSGYTQSSISNLLLSKSPFYGSKARTIEKYLLLPDGWLDKKNWIRSGWSLIETYRNLDEEGRCFFNKTITFAIEMLNSKGQI
jgi:hypothetical protein